MSKLKTVDLRDPNAHETWANIKDGDLVILADRDFELNEQYEDLVYQQFEDELIGVLGTDHTYKKHDSLMNVYLSYKGVKLEVPFIVRKANVQLSSDKPLMLSFYKRQGLKFQHLAEPVFNVS